MMETVTPSMMRCLSSNHWSSIDVRRLEIVDNCSLTSSKCLHCRSNRSTSSEWHSSRSSDNCSSQCRNRLGLPLKYAKEINDITVDSSKFIEERSDEYLIRSVWFPLLGQWRHLSSRFASLTVLAHKDRSECLKSEENDSLLWWAATSSFTSAIKIVCHRVHRSNVYHRRRLSRSRHLRPPPNKLLFHSVVHCNRIGHREGLDLRMCSMSMLLDNRQRLVHTRSRTLAIGKASWMYQLVVVLVVVVADRSAAGVSLYNLLVHWESTMDATAIKAKRSCRAEQQRWIDRSLLSCNQKVENSSINLPSYYKQTRGRHR